MTEPIVYVKAEVERFFWLARERYQIKLRKDAGEPRPWTQDRLLDRYHFCNVFRSDDRVSRAIRELATKWEPWPAVLLGRLCNKEATIQAMGNVGLGLLLAPEFRLVCRQHGINTNAYRLNTPAGLNNVEGLVQIVERALPLGIWVQDATDIPDALQRLGPYLNGFVGYQIVLDLVELGWFPSTFDSSWSWVGPGAARGAVLITGGAVPDTWEERSSGANRPEMRDPERAPRVMAFLLRKSLEQRHWPWPERPWSIHEVEFMLCEYDKYVRKAPKLAAGGKVSGRLYRG